jgi:alanyl-tRNA synthetase
MTGSEIRRAFLDYFIEHGHKEIPSSPVVPAEDPTLLFTNAGMNQFKRIFTGEERRRYRRAVSAQKCIRVSGKHNDLENVGRTPRHHTFFEMMGNFSFGDYFKEEAVHFAWEFLLEKMGLPRERLYVTIYAEDDEAEKAWKKATDVDPERIYRLGRKDNYWSMGETGPQGPVRGHIGGGDRSPARSQYRHRSWSGAPRQHPAGRGQQLRDRPGAPPHR